MLVYLDDILIYSKDKAEHLTHLEQVCQVLREHKLYCKPKKCEFFKNAVEYLGHVISNKGIQVDPRKVQDVKEWPVAKNVSELRSFLGLASYYRRFVEGFAKIASPLTNLLHKDTPYVWTQECQEAMDKLKSLLSSAPILRNADPDLKFTVTTDASGFAVGAVLSQEDHEGHRPVAFESRKLSDAERNYATHEKEALAIIHALKIWRHYLEGQEFDIVTDHHSLTYLNTQLTLTRRQAAWVELLQAYHYEIKYKPGKTNVVADALSRRPDLANIEISPSKDFLERIRQGYEDDVKDIKGIELKDNL